MDSLWEEMEQAMMERRCSPRVEPVSPLKARMKASIPVRLVDLSARGAQLELHEPLSSHGACELKLVADSVEVTLRAVVRRCRVWGWSTTGEGERVLLYRAGVQFEESSVPALSRLTDLMPQLFRNTGHTATPCPPAPGKGKR